MTYSQFWLDYLRAHDRPGTRGLHYVGSLCALVLLATAVVLGDWRFFVAAVVVGYGFAWVGHVAIERNRPATFGHPVWSLFSDYRMFALWVCGRLEPHLRRAKARSPG